MFAKKVLVLVLCLSMVMVLLCGCGQDKMHIENVIKEFQTACNYEQLQIDAILRVINPSVSEKIALAVSVIGAFTNTDTDQIFEKIASFLVDDASIDASEFFKSIDIEIEKIKVRGKNATVQSVVTYSISGVPLVREAEIKCVKKSDKWYINGIKFTE